MNGLLNRDYLNPYIIAEIGVNHEGSVDRAVELIWAAARGGAHAAKFQTYKADTLASPTRSPAYWDTSKEPTESQHSLFTKYDSFGASEYGLLSEECDKAGIDFMSTPFDLDSVDALASLVPAFKIASADLTNIPLLRKVASTGKPIIMSTGASKLEEIAWALDLLEQSGASDVALLHCVLRYPTPPDVANVFAIKTLFREFSNRATIGYSDHVPPSPDGSVPALEMASILGARILEKHFTDDRSAIGNDHYHAFDEVGLSQFVGRLAEFRTLSGDGILRTDHQAAAIENARRRIFVAGQLERGRVLEEADLIALRANVGIEIAQWDDVVGKKLTNSKAAGDPVLSEDLAP